MLKILSGGRYRIILMVIGPLAFCILSAGGLIVTLVGSVASTSEAFICAQCEGVIGSDLDIPETTTKSAAKSGESWSPSGDINDSDPSALPSANPLAAMADHLDDDRATGYERDCADAMRIAPPQTMSPPRNRNSGIAVDCARRLALAQTSSRVATGVGTAGQADAGLSLAEMTRHVVYQATSAAVTGHCNVEDGADTSLGDAHPQRALHFQLIDHRRGAVSHWVLDHYP
ncbi:hypothetical protein ACIHAX_32205 [Nocardia sp. NPDC051929]|uniref:hypothetical protein n=1 Tax=unclassified Nocardia TaxID=2637762 RepID=UPI003427EE05